MLAVTKFDNLDNLGPLESEWNDLLSIQEDESTVFYTPEWFRCWWGTFGGNAVPFILLVRDENRLIGIAPMMIRRQRNRGFPTRMLGFIENGNSLHNNFILHPRERKEALTAIVQYLMEAQDCWDIVEFKNLPEDSRNCSLLKEIITTNEILSGQKRGLISPYITIHSDWKSFYKNRSGKTRKTLRNIRNRIHRAGDFSVEEINDYATYRKIAPELYDIARNSWTDEIGNSLNSPANRNFFDQLSHTAADNGWLSVWLLKIGSDPVAFEYHLKYHHTIHGMRGSHKKNYGRMSPGVFLDSYIIQQIFERRDVAEYDLGGSNDYYKRKWTEDCRRHMTAHLFNISLYSRLLYGVEYKVIPAIKRILRKSA